MGWATESSVLRIAIHAFEKGTVFGSVLPRISCVIKAGRRELPRFYVKSPVFLLADDDDAEGVGQDARALLAGLGRAEIGGRQQHIAGLGIERGGARPPLGGDGGDDDGRVAGEVDRRQLAF